MLRSIATATIATAIACALATPALAKTDGIETAGQIVAFSIPITAAGISLFKSDEDGLLQLGVSELATVGTAYGLKFVVHEQRPDGSDDRSFPSETTAGAFSGATFLQKRYGWSYGLPAYALATFVGYSRVAADRHHWWDCAAGAAIGWGITALVTERYSRVDITASAGYAGRPLGFGINMRW